MLVAFSDLYYFFLPQFLGYLFYMWILLIDILTIYNHGVILMFSSIFIIVHKENRFFLSTNGNNQGFKFEF